MFSHLSIRHNNITARAKFQRYMSDRSQVIVNKENFKKYKLAAGGHFDLLFKFDVGMKICCHMCNHLPNLSYLGLSVQN